jgi:hypothetical protein
MQHGEAFDARYASSITANGDTQTTPMIQALPQCPGTRTVWIAPTSKPCRGFVRTTLALVVSFLSPLPPRSPEGLYCPPQTCSWKP